MRITLSTGVVVVDRDARHEALWLPSQDSDMEVELTLAIDSTGHREVHGLCARSIRPIVVQDLARIPLDAITDVLNEA
jgi:hypothetical protein